MSLFERPNFIVFAYSVATIIVFFKYKVVSSLNSRSDVVIKYLEVGSVVHLAVFVAGYVVEYEMGLEVVTYSPLGM